MHGMWDMYEMHYDEFTHKGKNHECEICVMSQATLEKSMTLSSLRSLQKRDSSNSLVKISAN
jgi:hypothetical protein